MRLTPPLSPEFEADIDRFIPVLQRAWKVATGFQLAQWQVDILRRATEVYPAGHERAGQLRYRQYFVSLGRQNGKSELAAAFCMYSMLRDINGAYVVGIARSVEQANLVYDRVASIVRLNPALQRLFVKVTETRGLRLATGGRYQMKSGTEKALQGVPVSSGLADELHLLNAPAWDALLAGTGGRPNTLVFGITTAGDDSSELLRRLYDNADKAARGELDRFGFTIYESPEARIPDDDETLGAFITAANPAVAAGYKDLGAVISDVRALPRDAAIRFVLNRFISGSASSFMDLSLWASCASTEPFPEGPAVLCVDRTPDQRSASIAAAVKLPDETVATKLIAGITSPLSPTTDMLERTCVKLWGTGRVSTFALDSYSLKDLAARLKGRGIPVRWISQADQYAATSTLYATVARKKLRHAGDPTMTFQVPRAATKAQGENSRIIRGVSRSDVDAVIATANAVNIAQNQADLLLQIF